LTTKLRAALAVAIAAALLAPTAQAADPASPAAAGPLAVQRSSRLSERLVEVVFSTPALEEPTPVRILLPAGYDDPANADRRYPVLYLLHGGLGSHLDWTEQGDAAAITGSEQMIVVMPDGGGDGNYVDWYNHGAGGPPMWETYHVGQLLPWVDANLRTIPTRAQRAIAGLSMGGAGSTHYAARHPDLFSAVAAFSGALDTNDTFVIPVTSTGGLQSGKLPGSVYGDRVTQEIRWRADNAWDLAENLAALPTILLATGNGEPDSANPEAGCTYADPVEMGVHAQSVSLHNRLEQLHTPHVWDDYGPGCHSWWYWQRELRDVIPALRQHFATNVPAPRTFTFKAAEPTYDVFGWRVEMDRPAMEWSVLEVLSPKRFRITGSGTARVTAPNGKTAVVDLGPGNPFQAYTAPTLLLPQNRTTREVTLAP
jgi:S-formylglutathione hydrolase FrmB